VLKVGLSWNSVGLCRRARWQIGSRAVSDDLHYVSLIKVRVLRGSALYEFGF
jgi:hypothetical protein